MAFCGNDIYAYYISVSKKPVNKTTFKKVWDCYVNFMQSQLLEGKEVHLFGLGTIVIRRVKALKPLIDMKSTKEHQAKGNEGVIYYTDTDWLFKFKWLKPRHFPIYSTYTFKATRGDVGLKTKLLMLHRADENFYLNFKLQEPKNPKVKFR